MNSESEQHRKEAAEMAEGDVIAILLRQHADIIDAMERVHSSSGQERADAFGALAKFLTAHERAEQTVVRTILRDAVGDREAADRDAEEAAADTAIAELLRLGTQDPDFDAKFSAFMKDVSSHAENEEHEEFPAIVKQCGVEQRVQLGGDFMEAFAKSP